MSIVRDNIEYTREISSLITLVNSKLNLDGGTMSGPIINIIEKKVIMAGEIIDLTQGNVFTKNINSDTTFTISGNTVDGNVNSFILEITNGGSYLVTWFDSIKWASGAAPALTAMGIDTLGFISHDGGVTWMGYVLGKDML